MGRSGQRVTLIAPDVPLVGHQPPLNSGTLIASLLEIGRDLLPGIEFSVVAPTRAVDLYVMFGDPRARVHARRTIGLNAAPWSADLYSRRTPQRWRERVWLYGSLAAGALAAGEAFKISMRKLRRFARAPQNFDEVFAFSDDLR